MLSSSAIPLPDLLSPRRHAEHDDELLDSLLELAFLGKESATEIDDALDRAAIDESAWQPEQFAEDLFLDELVRSCLVIRRNGVRIPVHASFLRRVLERPPCDPETVRYRQAILRELAGDAAKRESAEQLYDSLRYLLSLFKAARSDARLNYISFRLDILRHARKVIDRMAESFPSAQSGLRRLHEVGLEIQESDAYRLLTALLEYEGNLTTMQLEVRLGADGRMRRVAITDIAECTGNRFYRTPWQRWLDMLRLLWRRGSLNTRQVIDELVFTVYLRLAPAIRSLLQVLAHLEVYLASLGFAEEARQRGLEVSIPEVGEGRPLHLERLFNPLLLRSQGRPEPCTVETAGRQAITIVTGPNSGGKTRLLQALGLAQILGQSGLYAPCARASMPLYQGLFVSLVDRGDVDQPEGRLGSELLRIRRLFQTAPSRSLVLLDELCSGTNPSEAIEIVSMVLQLLQVLSPTAFITTHFLDFAQQLEKQPPVPGLRFLQVEVDDEQCPTYRFIPGIAGTSLAAGTARRLGVTFDELVQLIRSRNRFDQPETAPVPALSMSTVG